MALRSCAHCDDGALPVIENDDGFPMTVCTPCARRLPDALLKAAVDPFDYAMQLRTGDVIRFEHVEIRGAWVHLQGVKEWDHAAVEYPVYTFERGLDIRIADIVWVCDAPCGS